jgi:hypothetical protein
MLRKIPQKHTSHLHGGRSLKSCIILLLGCFESPVISIQTFTGSLFFWQFLFIIARCDFVALVGCWISALISYDKRANGKWQKMVVS